MISRSGVIGLVTIDDIKKELKEYNLRVLTGGDDEVIQRCLDKAVIWVKAKVRNCAEDVDFEDEVIKQVVIKRTLYELYSFAENEEIAKDKKEDALELLRALYGDCIKGETAAREGKELYPPYAYVVPGKESWEGYK